MMISGQVDDLLAIQNVNALCLPENYRLNVGNLNDAAAASCYLSNFFEWVRCCSISPSCSTDSRIMSVLSDQSSAHQLSLTGWELDQTSSSSVCLNLQLG